MPNFRVLPSSDPSGKDVATDTIASVEHQLIKQEWGAAGTANQVDDATNKRFPVGGAQIGDLTEAAPASDTASSGLNGRLQRIAQRLTAIITTGLISLAGEIVATVTITSGQPVSAAFDRGGYRSLGVIIPIQFDGASISFQASDTLSGTYVPVNDIYGNPLSVPVAVSNAYDLPGELGSFRFLKIVASTNQTTTNTDLLVIMRT